MPEDEFRVRVDQAERRIEGAHLSRDGRLVGDEVRETGDWHVPGMGGLRLVLALATEPSRGVVVSDIAING